MDPCWNDAASLSRYSRAESVSSLSHHATPHHSNHGGSSTREIYYSNATRMMEDMDRQWNEWKTLDSAADSSHKQDKLLEIVPAHDFAVPEQMIVRTIEDNTNGLTTKATAVEEKEGLSDLWKARLLLIGAAALYGTNFSLVKLLGDVMPVGVSTTLRFGAAALVTMPWLLQDIRKDNDALVASWLGFEVGLWNSIGYVSQAVGLDSTPAAESAFICSLAVVTVPILDFLAGKKLLPRQWGGAFLAVVGVALLELVGGAGTDHSSLTSGDLLTLVQPFAFGIGFWRMEQAMHNFPRQASRMTAAQLLAVFMASLTYGFWAIDLQTLQTFPWSEWMTDTSILFSLFWTGIITTAMTIYMENKAMETLSAAETTLIFSTEPLWGTAFAGVVMGEQLGPNVALGAVFILTACVYSNLGLGGVKNLWQGGVASVERLNLVGRRSAFLVPSNSTEHHLSMKRQLAWFTSSAATSWAWWKVAASNIPSLDELTDLLEEIIRNLP